MQKQDNMQITYSTMQELKARSGSPELDSCGMTKQGPLPKAGTKDSVTLCQLNDCISYHQSPRDRGPKPQTKTMSWARNGEGEDGSSKQKTDREVWRRRGWKLLHKIKISKTGKLTLRQQINLKTKEL